MEYDDKGRSGGEEGEEVKGNWDEGGREMATRTFVYKR